MWGCACVVLPRPHAQAQTRTRIPDLFCLHSLLSHTHILSLPLSLSRVRTLSLSLSIARARSPPPSLTLARSLSLTLARARALSLWCAQSLSVSLFLSPNNLPLILSPSAFPSLSRSLSRSRSLSPSVPPSCTCVQVLSQEDTTHLQHTATHYNTRAGAITRTLRHRRPLARKRRVQTQTTQSRQGRPGARPDFQRLSTTPCLKKPFCQPCIVVSSHCGRCQGEK